MKCKHNTLILVSAAIWLAIGTFLLVMGVRLMGETILNPALAHIEGKFSITSLLSSFCSTQTNRVVVVCMVALFLGQFKGKMALAKSVKRQIARIKTLPNPAPIQYLYSKGYYLLIASMMGMGFLLRALPITIDTRGAIDVIIGSALINGALLFFRTVLNDAYLKKRKA